MGADQGALVLDGVGAAVEDDVDVGRDGRFGWVYGSGEEPDVGAVGEGGQAAAAGGEEDSAARGQAGGGLGEGGDALPGVAGAFA